MVSESGRYHTFDSSADGSVRGEGCCAIVLKRYSNITPGKHPIGVQHHDGLFEDFAFVFRLRKSI
jgi:hypothetical protein